MLADRGVELVYERLDEDQFHEIRLRSPDVHLLQLLEAPTFSVTDDDYPPPAVGRCIRVELACALPEATRRFFEQRGFLGSGIRDGTDGAEDILLAAPGLTLALLPSRGGTGIALAFEPGGTWQAMLQARGMAARRCGSGWQLAAPEGTLLRLAPEPG